MAIKSSHPGAASRVSHHVVLLLAVSAAALTASAFASPAAFAAGQQMIETGSSLLYPLFNLWIPEYVKSHKDLQITPQSTGSGTGISQAIDGTAQIAAGRTLILATLSPKSTLP